MSDMEGKEIKKEEIDLLSRMMSMQKTHPSYAMTGAMCTAAAVVVKGSIVNQVCADDIGYTVYPDRTSGRYSGMWCRLSGAAMKNSWISRTHLVSVPQI